MSFGRRLQLFFVGIVVVPMIVLAVLVLQVSRDSRAGQADARLASGLETARTIYEEALQTAPDEAKRIAERIGARLADPPRPALAAVADRELEGSGLAAVSILGRDGEVLASSGPEDAIAVGESAVRTTGGGILVGTVRVAALDSDAFLARVQDLTSRDAALLANRGVLASTTDLGDARLPDGFGPEAVDLELPSGDSRAAALSLEGAPAGARLVLFAPVASASVASEPAAAAALAIFFGVAFVLLLLLVRDLQRRIAAMLEAARRIGEGHLDHRVPVEGNDEMAGLAEELNRMSDRLSTQMGELKRQRGELDESVKRIGEAFASGLDRRALLEIVAETAVSATSAEGARVVLRARGDVLASVGSPKHLEGILEQASDAAWDSRGEGSAGEGDCHAIAQGMNDRQEGNEVLCAMAVARRGEAFSRHEREVLRYLVVQTLTSIENIDLHERVSKQAFIDDLTDIPNKRRFGEWLANEVARVERFGGELSLVMLDIDDFKAVNDTFGHLQGNRVLERIGAILREESRDVDLAARYGGEEFVLALPETPREGAMRAAERLRVAIEGSSIPGSDGNAPVEVTASLGIATMPEDGNDARSLVAAADRALYQAKRAGKNRVEAPALAGATSPQGIRPPLRN